MGPAEMGQFVVEELDPQPALPSPLFSRLSQYVMLVVARKGEQLKGVPRLRCRPPVFLENGPVSTLCAQTQILNIPPSKPGVCRKITGAIILMFSVLFVCFIILYHPPLLGLPTL